MIWNSVPLLTAIDFLIIAVSVYAIMALSTDRPQPSALKIGLRWIALGDSRLSVLFC